MTKKLSISLPDDVEQAARAAAGDAGIALSAWLARAVRHELDHEALRADGREAIMEEIAENGPFVVTPEEQRWIDGVLASVRGEHDAEERAAS